MQPRFRAALVLVFIAVASAIAGAAIDRTFLVRTPSRGARSGPSTPQQNAHRRAEMLDRLDKDLALTPVQRSGIDTIFQYTDSTLRAIRHEAQPRIEQVLEGSRTAIAARLDSAQREKFVRLSAERHRRAGRP